MDQTDLSRAQEKTNPEPLTTSPAYNPHIVGDVASDSEEGTKDMNMMSKLQNAALSDTPVLARAIADFEAVHRALAMDGLQDDAIGRLADIETACAGAVFAAQSTCVEDIAAKLRVFLATYETSYDSILAGILSDAEQLSCPAIQGVEAMRMPASFLGPNVAPPSSFEATFRGYLAARRALDNAEAAGVSKEQEECICAAYTYYYHAINDVRARTPEEVAKKFLALWSMGGNPCDEEIKELVSDAAACFAMPEEA